MGLVSFDRLDVAVGNNSDECIACLSTGIVRSSFAISRDTWFCKYSGRCYCDELHVLDVRHCNYDSHVCIHGRPLC